MIELEKAYSLVLGAADPLPVETCPLDDALGRYLAQPLAAQLNIPPFAKSAMDGYALPAGDHRERYTVVGTVAAGDYVDTELRDGECFKIMTGAPVPHGADRVVRVEYVEREGDGIRLVEPEPGANVVLRGENLEAGDHLLNPCLLRPFHVAILAEQGFDSVPVARRLRASVLSTGSELRRPPEPLEPGQIYDSNGPQLLGQLVAAGADPLFVGREADDPSALRSAMEQALDTSDIVILSGGVSMGDFDFVPRTARELGVEILFHKIAVKPGKPTLFGRRGDTVLFGLPGNPVSSYVIFETLVRPFILHRSGVEYRARFTSGTLTTAVSRPVGDRLEFFPVRVDRGQITPVRYTGSTHISALADVDAFLEIPQGVLQIPEGAAVHARLL